MREALALFAFGRMPKTEVPHLMKALGQNMLQIAAHEDVSRQGASPVLAGGAVFVAEGDAVAVTSDNPAIGDGDTEDVTGEIVEHRIGAVLPGRDMHHPALGPDLGRQGEIRKARFEDGTKAAAYQLGQHPGGEEKVVPGRMPDVTIRRQAAAGHQAMDMGVIVEFLRPRMQDCKHAWCAADPFWIADEIDDGAGGHFDQRAVALSLVLSDFSPRT